MTVTESDRGISILIGDSSGASGLSSITVLDQLMKRVQDEEGLAEPPLVGEYFDIVAGAGTGAITMTLVGRLGMTTEKAIKSFARLSEELFSDGKMIGTPTFKASKMEKTLKEIVQEVTGNENELMLDERASSRQCKTIVFAMTTCNMNAGTPTIFRSYHTSSNAGPNCAIWQVLRAATAHPELFKSAEIEEQGISQSYVDAAMGCGNPIEHVLGEARRIYPNRHVSCIVSIGGGHPRTIRIPEASPLQRIFPTNVIVAMRDIATDNERMAQTMAIRFQGFPDVYFRLNVDQGMQSVQLGDWDRLGEITAHTRAYMQRAETNKLMTRAVKSIQGRRGVIPVKHIDGEIQLETIIKSFGVKECPAPTPVYTERHQPIRQAMDCLASSTWERRVFVFHGLGGAGKTQLALQTIERTREHWSDVVYADATSVETLTSTLTGFALARKIGNTYEDTLRWLGSYTGPWILLFDNADDDTLDLQRYFPKGTHGRILITTRTRDVALLAQGPNSDCNVSSMEPDEALQLLLTVARSNQSSLSNPERDAAVALVEDLGFLALAMVQAGAYIWRTACGFAKYRDMYASRPREMLEKYSQVSTTINGYEKTVYGTWVMSYNLLSERAQEMLRLLAYLQRDRVTPEIFRRAATRIGAFKPVLPLTGTDESALKNIKDYLGDFLDSNGTWNPDSFLTVMAEIMSYSLISFDRVNETYELHVLVQAWIRTMIPHSPEVAVAQSAFLLTLSVGDGQSVQDFAFCRSLGLHVDTVMKHSAQVNPENAAWFGYILRQNTRLEEAKQLQLRVLQARAKVLGNDDLATVSAMSELATTYHEQGVFKQAGALLLQVLKARKRLLGDGHPDTLHAMHNLSITYANLGLYKQAGMILVQLLQWRKRTLGDDHLDAWTSMSNLAGTYSKQGLYQQTEPLQVQVLHALKRLLGEDHPLTLTAMSNLAITYSDRGLHEQAEALSAQVLEGRKQIFGAKHPDTLIAMTNLASMYSGQGLHKQAEMLEVQVLETMKQLLGDAHPDTLSAMHNLAATYFNQNLHQQAERLQVQVLEGRKQILGDKHPDTLAAMSVLADTYSHQGLFGQAEALLVRLLHSRKEISGDEHPGTLRTMVKLALAYRLQGLFGQAETLLV
ncbi:hypothetical protein FRC08_010039 [Ceratobasidium sp. 394]|nr:hypothetical protein FRC08_010039 [Ceratobasidium sp. 394]